MFQHIPIIGFISQSPQMLHAPDGTPATNFSVATRQIVSKEPVATCPQRLERVPQRQQLGADHLVQGDGLAQARRGGEPVPGEGLTGLCRGRAARRRQRWQPEPAHLAGERRTCDTQAASGQLRGFALRPSPKGHGPHRQVPGPAALGRKPRGERWCARWRAAARRGGRRLVAILVQREATNRAE